MPLHTPGPYKVEQRSADLFAVLGTNEDHGKKGVCYSGQWLTVCTTDGRDEADRIALCLNCHDDLLAALQNLRNMIASGILSGDGKHNVTAQADRAIAKAEG